ncbi:MAG: malonate-semialdehyde dehydrogenase, partial [Acidobacteria bacterium]|nr:malonate-semialdehyde dehydrogenase [Acidobacteriota bacterium]
MIAAATEVRTLRFYVNGRWEEAAWRSLHPINNPATGETIAQVPYATAEDIDRVAR